MIKKFYLPILILAAFLTSCDFRSAYDTEIYSLAKYMLSKVYLP